MLSRTSARGAEALLLGARLKPFLNDDRRELSRWALIGFRDADKLRLVLGRQSNRERLRLLLHGHALPIVRNERKVYKRHIVFKVYEQAMNDLQSIARQLVEIIAKLQFIAVQLEKAAKEQDKLELDGTPSAIAKQAFARVDDASYGS